MSTSHIQKYCCCLIYINFYSMATQLCCGTEDVLIHFFFYNFFPHFANAVHLCPSLSLCHPCLFCQNSSYSHIPVHTFTHIHPPTLSWTDSLSQQFLFVLVLNVNMEKFSEIHLWWPCVTLLIKSSVHSTTNIIKTAWSRISMQTI